MDSLREKIEDIERQEIMNALTESNWVMAKAARKLGITERMISYRMRKYGIQKEVVKEREDIGQQKTLLTGKVRTSVR